MQLMGDTSGRQLAQQSSLFQPIDVYGQQTFRASTVQRTASTIEEAQQPTPGQTQNGNELIGYYFGSISRETAEWILRNHGNPAGGAYLLRSSGPNDDFVLSLSIAPAAKLASPIEVLHYKIVETEDSFVALHGQVGNEKFATIDELIDKAQGVATKPCWPVMRQTLESQILPPTYWGLTVDQVRLAILIKAKQWGFPLPLASLFQQSPNIQQELQASPDEPAKDGLAGGVTTLNNETIRTLIYKSLHEFQPWFHGKIGREEAERRIEEATARDGRFLVRERDNYSYAMCICHKRTTKHYRIDVLPTGELAIQDGRKFTSLMSLVSHYTIMSDGLWCALTEACARPIQSHQGAIFSPGLNKCDTSNGPSEPSSILDGSGVRTILNQNLYCNPQIKPVLGCSLNGNPNLVQSLPMDRLSAIGEQARCDIDAISQMKEHQQHINANRMLINQQLGAPSSQPTEELIRSSSAALSRLNTAQPGSVSASMNGNRSNLVCSQQGAVQTIKAPIREWLQTINHKWSQLMASKSHHQQSLNSFLFGTSNPLNNHCRHHSRHRHTMSHQHDHHQQNRKRKCRNGHTSCAVRSQVVNLQQQQQLYQLQQQQQARHLAPLNISHLSGINTNTRQRQQSGCESLPLSLARPGIGPCCHNLNSNVTLPNTNRSILSQLPQNSGFALSSQSFVGSPLFSIKQQQKVNAIPSVAGLSSLQACRQPNNLGSSSGSGSGSSIENQPSESGRLISPAQSISANLNKNTINPYNPQTTDIYGSQTSTALVNDHVPTSSSSSQQSGKTNNLIQHAGCLTAKSLALVHKQLVGQRMDSFPGLPAGVQHQQFVAQLDPAADAQSVARSGQIVCGQHAGPAFRYTNCGEENTFKRCFHRQSSPAAHRALDDLQLASSGPMLAGPAALTKFVQFQDGQCLRTHRDTMSIKMAYLSSQRQPAFASANNCKNDLVPHKQEIGLAGCAGNSDSRPAYSRPSVGTNNQPASHMNHELVGAITTRGLINSNNNNGSGAAVGCLATGGESLPASKLANQQPMNQHHTAFQQAVMMSNGFGGPLAVNNCLAPAQCNPDPATDIDLMDCGREELSFRYDPKLIKSSSIETLCGHAEESAEYDLDCKSNRELLMSLQRSYWQQQHETDILSPMNIAQSEASMTASVGNNALIGALDAKLKSGIYNEEEDEEDEEEDGEAGGRLLSGLIVGPGAPESEEKLNSMRKKHDIDALTTSLLEELTASLKAQVDLKNKRSGLSQSHNMTSCDEACQRAADERGEAYHSGGPTNNGHNSSNRLQLNGSKEGCPVEVNPLDLINEFDTLISNNR